MEGYSAIGKRVPRIDGFAKVTGSAKYTGDIVLPNMLIGNSFIVPIIVESIDSKGPYGAKEAGEGPGHVGPGSIANALEDAIGIRIKRFPITPDMVIEALEDR